MNREAKVAAKAGSGSGQKFPASRHTGYLNVLNQFDGVLRLLWDGAGHVSPVLLSRPHAPRQRDETILRKNGGEDLDAVTRAHFRACCRVKVKNDEKMKK